MARRIKLGLAQITGEPYAPARNRARSVQVAAGLFERGAHIAILPELIIPGYGADRERMLPIAEPIDGESVGAWTALAAEHSGWVVGGFCERDGDRLFNTAVVVGPEGVVLHYRKLHRFREEKLIFAPGDLGLPTVDLPFGRVGVCVCYDLRFVETVRILALQEAELVCIPTAWLSGFDAHQWDARGLAPQADGAILQANLDQVFIACASQVGQSGEYAFLGSSIVADPRGRVLVGPLSGTEEAESLVEVDLDEAARSRVRDELIRPRADRRTDVYGVAFGGRVL